VLYSLRHSFLTMLGASGKVDVWRLAQIAGHSSIAMSMRYVHPQGDAVLDAMALPDGPVFGHTYKTDEEEKRLSA
jgi:integrase